MDFAQKRMATHTWFTFDEKELCYRVRDNSGDVEFEVEYANIPASSRTVFDRNRWLRNVGVIWLLLGVLQSGLALAAGNFGIGSMFWIFIGLACLAFYRLTWSTFTVLDSPEGSIWVIQDAQHDDILGKINEKRKSCLMAWYNSLNFEDDPSREIQTIEWLLKQKVLEKTEAETKIADLRASETVLISHDDDQDTDPKKLH